MPVPRPDTADADEQRAPRQNPGVVRDGHGPEGAVHGPQTGGAVRALQTA